MNFWRESDIDNLTAIGRRALVASLASILLASAWQPAAGDALQDYARQCDQAIGVTVPDFDCDAGTEVPAQGMVFSGNQPGVTCNQPNRLNQRCDPGSKFQVLTSNPNAYVVAHCRKEGGDAGMYGDIAVIQYSRKNGATCFYQALGNQDHGNMPGGSSAPSAPAKPVKAPSSGEVPKTFWLPPATTAGIGCGGCHDNGPFIRSPYINGVTDANKLPGSDDEGFNSNQPYAFIGSDFSTWKAYQVEVALNECNDCHRLGVNNVRAGEGTALDFAIRATSASEVSKNPPSAASPIWMPPHPVQTAFDPSHAASAQAIHDCAAQFDPNNPGNLPNTDACRIALFAQAYSPSAGPTGQPGGPPVVASVSPFSGQCNNANNITINGSNFSGTTSVVASGDNWSIPLQNVSVSPNQITATVPATPSVGLYEIVVTTPIGTSSQPVLSTRTDLFSVTPTVTGISPSDGPVAGHTAVTITGTCFDFPGLNQNRVKVFFGGSEAGKGFDQCASASKCVVYSPPATWTAVVNVVVSVDGAASAVNDNANFTYTGPYIASLQPNHGPKTGGTSVEISGGGFPPYTWTGNNLPVSFGAADVSGLCLGSTVAATSSCSVVTPPVANAGPVQVIAAAFGATSAPSAASVFTFDEFPALTQFRGPDSTFDGAVVSLNGNAPPGGAAVSISSSDATVVRSQQPIVTVAAGKQGAEVPLIQSPSAVAKQVTLTATYQGSSASAVVSVPASPALAVRAPTHMGVNQAAAVEVVLNAPAPAGGANIALSSSDPAAIAVPASNSVTIPAGDYTAKFQITNLYGGARKWVKLSATYSGASASSSIWVPYTVPVCHVKKCPKGSYWIDEKCACVHGLPM
jgi:hypothetical protein